MIISWNITKACQLKCRHCYRDAGTKEADELTTAEGKDLIEQIALAGFKILIISGGEPLMRKDVYELIAHAKDHGLRPVLGTNGIMIDTSVARRLKAAGLTRAGISLDSTNEAVHDDFRQDAGSWQGSLAGMKACVAEGLDFQIHTTVTTYNYQDVEKITDLAVSLGAKAHHIFFLVPTGRGKDLAAVIPSSEYQLLLKKIMQKQLTVPIELKPVCAPQFVPLAHDLHQPTRFTRGCLAGVSYCCILPNGDVHPCPYFPIKVGNVRNQKFSLMWRDHALFKELRSGEYNGNCGGCQHKSSCGGCRARAYAQTGNYMDFDPECIY
ncbi:MAG: radical SAM protein [Candidatus Omnitrophica bacterium]|nr:radical SAM protein [Candidatus Omnitrophota bacterium]